MGTRRDISEQLCPKRICFQYQPDEKGEQGQEAGEKGDSGDLEGDEGKHRREDTGPEPEEPAMSRKEDTQFLFTLLVGCTSLAEDAVIRDSVDKKEDVSLKKSYAGTHLALRAGIYGTYVAQSLLSDLKALNNALDGSSDCSELMSLIKRQVEFLLDISFDVVRASALVERACVSARRNFVLRDWKTVAAQGASALRLPFQGNVLFGAELEEKLHKLFKEKKHSSSFRSTLGDRHLFRRRSPVPAPSRHQFVRSQGRFPMGSGRDKKHKSPPSS
ncbi:hypothetical protein NDU88_006459 [Pleurodeles waltl]|uniref:Lamina-associated polypeptide 2 alpha C-terminal domain-containing protein n=1 Tax=Pleurodeles waltl TaxID=8319 RepID=A0AAV7X2Q1_PLEWA|nr:hypothetical protein NDU88_006459 [Pleurodeles waltl]